MQTLTHDLIVAETKNGELIATRFRSEFEKRKQELYDSVADIPPIDDEEDDDECRNRSQLTLNMYARMIESGLELRQLQDHVIGVFSRYAACGSDKDILKAIFGDADPDMHDVIEIVKEFNLANPDRDIVSMIPIDIRGAYVFITRASS